MSYVTVNAHYWDEPERVEQWSFQISYILSVVRIPYVSLDSNLMQLPSTTGSVGEDSMNIVH